MSMILLSFGCGVLSGLLMPYLYEITTLAKWWRCASLGLVAWISAKAGLVEKLPPLTTDKNDVIRNAVYLANAARSMIDHIRPFMEEPDIASNIESFGQRSQIDYAIARLEVAIFRFDCLREKENASWK